MVATFLECGMVTHWLPHTQVQIFFCLVLELKKVWCCLSSLSIETGVFAETFRITLLYLQSMCTEKGEQGMGNGERGPEGRPAAAANPRRLEAARRASDPDSPHPRSPRSSPPRPLAARPPSPVTHRLRLRLRPRLASPRLALRRRCVPRRAPPLSAFQIRSDSASPAPPRYPLGFRPPLMEYMEVSSCRHLIPPPLPAPLAVAFLDCSFSGTLSP